MVAGETTTPPSSFSAVTFTQGVNSEPSPRDPRDQLLLIVLVPVGVVLLVTMSIVLLTVLSCWCKKR